MSRKLDMLEIAEHEVDVHAMRSSIPIGHGLDLMDSAANVDVSIKKLGFVRWILT
jgi:hypothetical protein